MGHFEIHYSNMMVRLKKYLNDLAEPQAKKTLNIFLYKPITIYFLFNSFILITQVHALNKSLLTNSRN